MRDGLSVGIPVGLSGAAFGAAATVAGLSVPQASVLSLLTFSGASQFALIGAVGAGGKLAAGAAGAVLLGSRNALYGLRLADTLGIRAGSRDTRRPALSPARRFLAGLLSHFRIAGVAHGVIDETTAVTTAQPDRKAARAGYAATFASIYITWNLATLAGAFGASRVGNPDALGLDAVVPAAFLALLWPRLRAEPSQRWVAVIAAGVAVAATPFVPSGVPVLLAAAVALAGVLGGRR